MGKKLLLILGALAVAGYLFRNQLKAKAQAAEATLQAFVEDRSDDLEDLKADIAARVHDLQAEKEK